MAEPKMRRVPVNPQLKSENAIPKISGKVDAKPVYEDPIDCDCPHLDHMDWDEAENDWSDIAFLRGTTNAVMGVPFGYQSLTAELRAKAAKRGFVVPEDAMVLLGEGKFRRPLLLEVDVAPSETKDIYRPGGIAFTHIAPGPPGKVKDVLDETKMLAKEKYGRDADAEWIWYLTCRICSAAREYETLVALHYRKAGK